jgi:hypothetical protein
MGVFRPGTMMGFCPHIRTPLPGGRVHFAGGCFVVLFRRIEVVYCACSGTETAVRWSGYADGAIESGQRCASEVLGRKFDFAARPAPTLMRNAPLGFSRTERLLPKLRSLILGAALLATALACKLFLL